MDRPAFEPARDVHHGSQSSHVAAAGTTYTIATKELSGKVEPQRAQRVIGVDPLLQYLVAAPGGRLQAMEVAYDPAKHDWFDVYGDEDRQPGEWGHWTGRGMNWNAQCAACHNTRLRKNYDAAADVYQTAMAEASVSCEACHGPMKPHVQWQRSSSHQGKDPTLPRFKRDQVTDTCASCHSRRGELTGDFVPGQSYFDHYALTVPDESDTFYADGQVRDEDYEWAAFMGSRMHAAGVRCTDCHDAHAAKPILAGNALCLRCHSGTYPNAPVIVAATHTFHAPDSAGSQCVNCHMPQTTYMQRHRRHDHGFTTPDPLLTQELGIPNACNRCHTDKDAAWAVAAADRWYGAKMDRPSRGRTRAIAAARKGDDSARGPLLALLDDPKQTPYWKSVAAGLLGRWAHEPAVSASLARQFQNDHPLVRASALAALAPELERQPQALAAARVLLNDASRNVRIGAAHALGTSPDAGTQAARDLAACLALQADEPTGQLQLAIRAAANNQAEAAIAHLRKTIEWDPRSAALRRDAAVLYGQLNQPQEALLQIEEAARLEPKNPDYAYLLGLAAAEAGRADLSLNALQRAVELDPTNARAWYNLALSRRDSGQADAAIEAFRRAEALDRSDPNVPYAAGALLAQLGRPAEARAAAQRALQIQPQFAPAAQLLRTLPGE